MLNYRRHIAETLTLIVAAVLCATVANALASRQRRLVITAPVGVAPARRAKTTGLPTPSISPAATRYLLSNRSRLLRAGAAKWGLFTRAQSTTTVAGNHTPEGKRQAERNLPFLQSSASPSVASPSSRSKRSSEVLRCAPTTQGRSLRRDRRSPGGMALQTWSAFPRREPDLGLRRRPHPGSASLLGVGVGHRSENLKRSTTKGAMVRLRSSPTVRAETAKTRTCSPRSYGVSSSTTSSSTRADSRSGPSGETHRRAGHSRDRGQRPDTPLADHPRTTGARRHFHRRSASEDRRPARRSRTWSTTTASCPGRDQPVRTGASVDRVTDRPLSGPGDLEADGDVDHVGIAGRIHRRHQRQSRQGQRHRLRLLRRQCRKQDQRTAAHGHEVRDRADIGLLLMAGQLLYATRQRVEREMESGIVPVPSQILRRCARVQRCSPAAEK